MAGSAENWNITGYNACGLFRSDRTTQLLRARSVIESRNSTRSSIEWRGHYDVAHYHREQNHQGPGNELIDRGAPSQASGAVRGEQRLGGTLNYYRRAA